MGIEEFKTLFKDLYIIRAIIFKTVKNKNPLDINYGILRKFEPLYLIAKIIRKETL
jgi:hypothetical protein